jgi:nanoRNase/pAp phosphatase (c-di-AMP/oligoRNAs hydrolase)
MILRPLKEWVELITLFESETTFQVIVQKGGAIEGYRNVEVEETLTRMNRAMIGGVCFPIVNVSSSIRSNLAHRLCLLPGGCLGATYFVGKDRRVEVSLRSDGDFNVAKIAEQYGGGGHKNASGFHVSLEEFVKMLV